MRDSSDAETPVNRTAGADGVSVTVTVAFAPDASATLPMNGAALLAASDVPFSRKRVPAPASALVKEMPAAISSRPPSLIVTVPVPIWLATARRTVPSSISVPPV